MKPLTLGFAWLGDGRKPWGGALSDPAGREEETQVPDCKVSSPVGSLKRAGCFKCTIKTLQLLWEGSNT